MCRATTFWVAVVPVTSQGAPGLEDGDADLCAAILVLELPATLLLASRAFRSPHALPGVGRGLGHEYGTRRLLYFLSPSRP